MNINVANGTERYLNKIGTVKPYLNEISKYPVLSHEEEYDLHVRIKNGDDRAKELLIKSNLRFVVSVAKYYTTDPLVVNDLINEGNLGLIEAISSFDLTKGFKFISHAVFYIRKNILKYFNENRLIKLPTNQLRDVVNINRSTERLTNELGRIPSDLEIIDDFNYNYVYSYKGRSSLSIKKLRISRRSSQKVSNLDKTELFEDEVPLINTINGDINVDNIDDEVISDIIGAALTNLDPINKYIIILKFGLNGNRPLSIVEIAELLDRSGESVRSRIKTALKSLKKNKQIKKIM